jgi:hypothetical protein
MQGRVYIVYSIADEKRLGRRKLKVELLRGVEEGGT